MLRENYKSRAASTSFPDSLSLSLAILPYHQLLPVGFPSYMLLLVGSG